MNLLEMELRLGEMVSARLHSGETWTDPDFHCYRMFTDDVRIWPVFWYVEGNISNGGLEQLMWNSFANYEELLTLAAYGYARIGSISYMGKCLEIRNLFRNQQPSLIHFIRRHGNDSQALGEWSYRVGKAWNNELQQAFFNLQSLESCKEQFLTWRFPELLAEVQQYRAS